MDREISPKPKTAWALYLESLRNPQGGPQFDAGTGSWTDSWIGPDESPNSRYLSLEELLAIARARRRATRAARAEALTVRGPRADGLPACGAVVRGPTAGVIRQCSRNAAVGGFCYQHHKALVTRRGRAACAAAGSAVG